MPASLLLLQESGNGTPLILIPGGSGERFLSYKKFAHSFFPDHPVYTLQSPYVSMIEGPSDPVSRLSTHFAQQIVTLVKGRPFVLFGHCVGGLLAWHVACALKKEMGPPFRMVLYDTPVPQKGINVTPRAQAAAPRSRLQRKIHAYRQAWNDWCVQRGDDWQAKAGFLLWALNNFFMRKGLDRWRVAGIISRSWHTCVRCKVVPLSNYPDEALLLYHHAQEEAVSRSLWRDHAAGKIEFEFIDGDHSDWEGAIHNTIPLIRHQLEDLDRLAAVSRKDVLVG